MKKILWLILFVGAQSVGQGQTLKTLVENEYAKSKAYFTNSAFKLDIGNLRLEKAGHSHIEDSGDLVIGLSQLEEYIGDGDIEFKKLFVRFVIAHEVAHRYQVKMMRHQRVTEASGEVVEFLECNADMLAGFFMTQLMNMADLPELMKNPSFDLIKYNKDRAVFMYRVYHRILDMYAAADVNASHPSNDDRRLSLRQGIMVGNLFYTQLLLSDPDARSRLTNQQIEVYKGIVELQQRGLNYDPARGPFIWAHEESIRIVSENNSVCQKMVIFGNKVEWHKTAENPTVDFSFKVMNFNPTKVRFAGRVTTEIVQRNNPSNVVVTVPVDGFLYDRAILPNEVVEISGTLRWIATDDFMPRIVLPYDNEGLYWAFDFDKPATDPKPRKRYSRPDGTGPIEDSEVTDLLLYLWANRNDLRSYVEGVGLSFARTPDRLTKGRIYYHSQFKLREDDGATMRYDHSDKRFRCSFNVIESSSYATVNRRYGELVKAILHELPLSSEQFPEEDNMKYTQFTKDGVTWAEVTMDYDEDKKTHFLKVTFFGKVEEW